MSKDCLPPNLRDAKHWDYPPGLRWIPRSWTAFCWGPPRLVAGNQREEREDAKTHRAGPAPIGERCSWQVSRFPGSPWWLRWVPLYVAITTKAGRHFRIGWRWDDVDGYVNGPTLASRKYTGERIQDTATGK